MSLTICKNVLHADYWIACLGTLFSPFVEGLFNRWNVFIRDILSRGSIDELIVHHGIRVSDVFIEWFQIANDFCVLTCSSRLLLVKVIEGLFLANRLPVVHSWVSNDDRHLVFSSDTFAVDKEMELTHT